MEIPVKFFRWDKWLKHPNFNSQQEKIKDLINDDPDYRAAFDISISNFLDKYTERLISPNNLDINKARQLSYDFVTEECTALTLWPELNCHFEIYPNKHNSAIQETRKRFIKPNYPDLLHSITIGFKNAKQINPQYFKLIA